MLSTLERLLHAADQGGYALGAFNVYNLEGARAVIAAAEAEYSPAILQIHPAALKFGHKALVALCLQAARDARVSMAVHLDHSTNAGDIATALEAGIASVMADGSHLPYPENIAFTRKIVEQAARRQATVEAELGRLSGTEDGLSVSEYEARFTDPDQAAEFTQKTGVQALAVCIGNIHGHYPREPRLDFERLRMIRKSVRIPLVLHGASGLPDETIQHLIVGGIRKFNVNTEVRDAYLAAAKQQLLAAQKTELLDLMQATLAAMQSVVIGKLRLFGSSNKDGQR